MRGLRQAPGFSATTIATLAAGIGAVVAMFAVYWAVVLNPVRLGDARQVVSIAREQRDPQVPTSLSWPRVQWMQRAARAFAAIGAYSNERVSLAAEGMLPRELRGIRVSTGFFEAVRLTPTRGRLLTPDDDLPAAPAVCVLAYETWQTMFAGEPLVGRTIRLNGQATEVVGILSPRVSAPWGDRQVFLPRVFADSSLTGAAIAAGASYLSVVARLAPGRTIAQANDELRRITADFRRAFAGRSDTINEVEVQPLADVIVANRKSTLTLLLGAVTLVLLVSCANAAALVVSRLSGRHRELAVRQALGATRAVIVRHIMGETVVLAVIAGAVGIVLAAIALRTIDATLGSVLPPGVLLRIDTPVLAVAMLAVVVAVVLVGVIPALHATRATSATGAAAFGRGSSESAATHRFRRGLVVTEVALSSGLLVGAALFLTSLSYVQHLPVGFDLSGLAAAAVILPVDTYPTPERQGAFFDDVLDRLTPKVARAAIAFGLPFAGDNFVSPYVIRGRAIPPPAARRRAGLRIVTEEYLTVMRIRLVAGRFFSAADRAGAQPVCVVNESFSRHEFGNRSPLGAVVLRGRDADQRFEIVGVVADVRTNGPTADPPDELFLPFRQVARPNAWLLVRTNGRPETAAPLLQSAVAAADRGLAVSGFTTMEAARTLTMGPERLLAGLATCFGLLALLLAAIGLYAVLAQSVAARTGEIGIRIAIGAGRWSIGRLVLTGALRLVGMGMLVGLTGAMAMSRIIAAQLHGISGRDPTVYAVVAGLFVVVAIGAAVLPARRATRVDPLVCLRAL